MLYNIHICQSYLCVFFALQGFQIFQDEKKTPHMFRHVFSQQKKPGNTTHDTSKLIFNMGVLTPMKRPDWTPIARWWQLKYCLFSPRTLGMVIQFDEHIFQRGWFNHHLVLEFVITFCSGNLIELEQRWFFWRLLWISIHLAVILCKHVSFNHVNVN